MRIIVQRVKTASVTINNMEKRSINNGLVVLVGINAQDNKNICDYMANKLCGLRIFADENDKMNNSILQVNGQCLIISNFTLYADCKKGMRPSFTGSAPPAFAEEVYNYFVKQVKDKNVKNVNTGEFGEYMQIDMVCDGPITITLDSDEIMPNKQ